jgi:uncharacterized membrane protein YdjX (TVP38/TMEM64 family)
MANGTPPPRTRLLRIGVFIAATVVAVGILKANGTLDAITPERVRAAVVEAGALGVLLFLAVFVAGVLVHVPGVVFVAAGILAYGKAVGFVVSFTGAVAAVIVSFLIVRAVGGRALSEIDRPFLKKMLARLDGRPVTTVIILRLFFPMAPPLNYGLALSSIAFRDYVVGSVVGLVVPLAVVTLFVDRVIDYYWPGW